MKDAELQALAEAEQAAIDNRNQETWEKACERVGVWDDRFTTNKYAPPLNDPGATVAMLEWLVKQTPQGAEIRKGSITTTYIWRDFIVGILDERKPIPLALAAAVCALKEDL